MSNVPDDWNMYWSTCERCGARYHASEGGCDCYIRFEEMDLDDEERDEEDGGCDLGGACDLCPGYFEDGGCLDTLPSWFPPPTKKEEA